MQHKADLIGSTRSVYASAGSCSLWGVSVTLTADSLTDAAPLRRGLTRARPNLHTLDHVLLTWMEKLSHIPQADLMKAGVTSKWALAGCCRRSWLPDSQPRTSAPTCWLASLSISGVPLSVLGACMSAAWILDSWPCALQSCPWLCCCCCCSGA